MEPNNELLTHIEELKHKFQRIEALHHKLQSHSNRNTDTVGEIVARLLATDPVLAYRLLTEAQTLIAEGEHIGTHSLYMARFEHNVTEITRRTAVAVSLAIIKLRMSAGQDYCYLDGFHSPLESPDLAMVRAHSMRKFLSSQLPLGIGVFVRSHICGEECEHSDAIKDHRFYRRVEVELTRRAEYLFVGQLQYEENRVREAYETYMAQASVAGVAQVL